MTLPAKLTDEYISEYLESYCVPTNEAEKLVSNLKISPLFQEIIKRYNNYPEMEELKNNYSDKITEYHKALTQSEQENKELNELLHEYVSDLGHKTGQRDKIQHQYNKLRDAIKDKIELHKVWDDKQVVAVLESILDSVEKKE